VDGSFIDGATGYGAVILKHGTVVDELSGAVDASEVNGTRQVAGELAGVKEALKWCLRHSVNEVAIYYDYLGIEKWARGQWKTNQPLTKAYARFVSDCPIKIQWRKVDSHTGNRWNDRADALAKQGALSLRVAARHTRRGKPTSGDDVSGESAGAESASRESGVNSAAGESDLIRELLRVTEAWIESLMLRGVEARLDGIYNEQFARVCIRRQDTTVGMFDLYNTKTKRFSPYIHNFRDNALKLRIESLWKEFRASPR
jgi:ribonuclease HI